MQGKTLIKKSDRGGWATCRTRNWGERCYDSDRQKGIRHVIAKQLRTRLKREADKTITQVLNDNEG